MLYVSRGPWSIYEVLDEFFNLHRIPVGPLLFLREWGLSLQRPLPRRAEDHKQELIRRMLALYRDLPFVLIGDSGQHDPEVYAQTVHEHPGRVLAIYIRNVSREPDRPRAIEALAVEVVAAGSSLLLAADSLAMAEHATQHGLIAPEALAEVEGEKEVGQDEAEPGPVRAVERPTAGATLDVVEPMGSESLLYVRTGAHDFIARVRPTARYTTYSPSSPARSLHERLICRRDTTAAASPAGGIGGVVALVSV